MSTSGRPQLPEHIQHELFGAPRRGHLHALRGRWAFGAGILVALAATGLWLLGPALSVPL